MPELEKLIVKIGELRDYMHLLIERKSDLLDPEIIAVSKMLDVMLLEYQKTLKNQKQAGTE